MYNQGQTQQALFPLTLFHSHALLNPNLCYVMAFCACQSPCLLFPTSACCGLAPGHQSAWAEVSPVSFPISLCARMMVRVCCSSLFICSFIKVNSIISLGFRGLTLSSSFRAMDMYDISSLADFAWRMIQWVKNPVNLHDVVSATLVSPCQITKIQQILQTPLSRIATTPNQTSQLQLLWVLVGACLER